MRSSVERGLKFDVDAGFSLPDLSRILPVGVAVGRTSEQLRSDYFDTADHALLAAGITLRRRSGSTDVAGNSRSGTVSPS